MVRTQIQLTEQQARQLRILAQRQGISVAEIVRRSVDRTLQADTAPDMGEIRRRALQAAGSFSDTAHDVAEHHDRYLA